jgi:hypothetical protein
MDRINSAAPQMKRIKRSFFRRRNLRFRDSKFSADDPFGIFYRIDSGKLHHEPAMLPSEELDFNGAPAAANLHLNLASRIQNAVIIENQVHSNGTTQSLSARHASDSNKSGVDAGDWGVTPEFRA